MSERETTPDLSKVTEYSDYRLTLVEEDQASLDALYDEARHFLDFYDWCEHITESYVGMFYPGIVGVFLFRIETGREDVDNWIWAIVGDLPPAYITCDESPNPATALDAYIGAMSEWVQAAKNGESVADLIPVNVPATLENATMLESRLKFLDEKILTKHQADLVKPA